MKVYVHRHGCRLNASESRHLIEQLESQGHVIVEKMDKTVAVAVVNSCAVTHQAESKCKQTIRQIVGANPEVALIVTGCLAEKNPQELLEFHRHVLILGNSEKHRIGEYVEKLNGSEYPRKIVKNPLPESNFSFPCFLSRPYTQRYNLKIQEGCNFYCSYCLIPQLRGRARSRDFKNLLEDATNHVQQGVREIVLTGVNIGVYQNDSKNLAAVIGALNDISELQRIRLSSVELKTIDDDILSQMADPKNKLVKYLHLPIQSGSDRILKLMRRHYGVAEARNYLEQVYQRIPQVGLGTDLIVGFPGETKEDFADSLDLLKNSPLQYAHVFSSSRREKTVANLMKEQFIAQAEVDHRSKILRTASHEKHRQFLEQQIGKIETVLFENGKKSRFPGFTENYARVFVKNSSKDLANQMGRVRLVKNCGTFIAGEIVG